MHYEVRFLVNGEEQSVKIDAESAAEAAQIAQSQAPQRDSEETFELIQVHFLDDASLSGQHNEPPSDPADS